MDTREALALARRLVREHDLDGWTVVLDNAKTRAGVCRFGPRQIGLSRPLTALHGEAHVRDTILHEIAHALVGPAHGHDAVWRRTARSLGCSGARCVPADAPTVRGDWVGRCLAGHEVTRHRRPRRVTSCSRCSRRFSPAHLMTWTHKGRAAPMHPAYLAELASLDVRLPAAARPGDPGPDPAGPADRRHDAPTLQLGDVARIVAPGRYHGVTGIVEGMGRTRYQVRVPEGILAVPTELLEAIAG